MHLLRHATPTALALVGAALALPSSAPAAGWAPAVPVAPGGSPQVASDGGGNLTAVWIAPDGTVRSATKAATSPTFANFQTLSDPDTPASNVQIAENAGGQAIVVWNQDDVVLGRLRRFNQATFQNPTFAVSDFAGVGSPRVGIDANGLSVTVWERGGAIEAKAVGAGGGTGAPVQTVDPSGAANPSIAVAADSTLTVTWADFAGSVWVLRAAREGAGTARIQTTAPVNLGDIGDAVDDASAVTRASLAADGSGRFTSVWYGKSTSCPPECGSSYPLTGKRLAADDAWNVAGVASFFNNPTIPVSPDVAVDTAGNAVLVYRAAPNLSSGDQRQWVIANRRSGHGGNWGSDEDLVPDTGTADVGAPQVAIGPQARSIAVWTRGGVVEGARSSGAFGAAQPLSTTGAADPQPIIDPQNNGWVLWTRTDSQGAKQVELAVYDTVKPVLGTVTSPETATATQTARFSGSATDTESAARVDWNFGDGETATGDQVDHAYAAPGTYTIEVSAVDGGGNSESTTRTITVAPAPVQPDPGAGNPNPGNPGPGGTNPPPTVDKVKPGLSQFTLAPKAFRRAKGTKLRLRLTEPATVVFTVERKKGRKWVAAGASWPRAGKAGANSFSWSGKVGKKKLALGSYRLKAVATDAAGNASAAVRASFRVKR